MIVYDTLFLALAEDSETVVITTDGRLLKALEGTAHACLAHPLADVGSLVPDGVLRTTDVLQPYCNRADTRWYATDKSSPANPKKSCKS